MNNRIEQLEAIRWNFYTAMSLLRLEERHNCVR